MRTKWEGCAKRDESTFAAVSNREGRRRIPRAIGARGKKDSESVESGDEGDEGRVQGAECEGLLFESEVSLFSYDREGLRQAK